MIRCYICNTEYEVSECIVCKKGVCLENHAEFWIDLNVNTDSGHNYIFKRLFHDF